MNVLIGGIINLYPVRQTIESGATVCTIHSTLSIMTFTSPTTVPKLVPVNSKESPPDGEPNLLDISVTTGVFVSLYSTCEMSLCVWNPSVKSTLT